MILRLSSASCRASSALPVSARTNPPSRLDAAADPRRQCRLEFGAVHGVGATDAHDRAGQQLGGQADAGASVPQYGPRTSRSRDGVSHRTGSAAFPVAGQAATAPWLISGAAFKAALHVSRRFSLRWK